MAVDRKQEMSFEESMTRARAAHVRVDSFNQPGNGYRREYLCKCGDCVFADDWDAHILRHADGLREASDGS